MSRSIQTIQNSILAAIAADPVLSNLNSTSQTAIYKLWSYIIATTQATEEQLYDQYAVEVEAIASKLPPATSGWIQKQAFNFQYSATNPQVIQFSTASFVPYYPVVNPSYRIITNCSIDPSLTNGYVNIKVAKGGTSSNAQALSQNELSAFQYYMNQIKPAGIQYFCTSQPADRLYSAFTVQYLGAYSSVIKDTLLAAYKNYLNSIDFGGVIKMVDILLALRQVPGVLDIQCNNMTARANSITFGSGGVNMVVNNSVNIIEYKTTAGYIIPEDTTGYDFISSLVLQPM